MELHEYPDHALQEELRRCKASHKPLPAFRCERCGEVDWYRGMFSAAHYAMQHASFMVNHQDCLATWNGGGI